MIRKKILDKARKIGLIGLSALLISCSASKKSAIISPRTRVKIFGGIEEKYSPVIMKAEYEYPQKEGYSYLLTPFFGFSSGNYTYEGKTYTSSTVLGLDFGIKWTSRKLYWKGSLGGIHLSRKFEKNEYGARGHDFQTNFHTEMGVGYQGEGWHIGPILSHGSVGNFLFNWSDSKQNSGFNTFGFELGTEF